MRTYSKVSAPYLSPYLLSPPSGQIRGSLDPVPSCDVYSFGILLWRLMAKVPLGKLEIVFSDITGESIFFPEFN